MRKDSSYYEAWRGSRCVLGKDIVEIMTDNGTRKKILGEIGNLHKIINEAMTTSQMNYKFEQQLRGIYESNIND